MEIRQPMCSVKDSYKRQFQGEEGFDEDSLFIG